MKWEIEMHVPIARIREPVGLIVRFLDMNLQIKQHLVLINPTSKRIKLDNGSPQPLCAQWLGRFLFISMKGTTLTR